MSFQSFTKVGVVTRHLVIAYYFFVQNMRFQILTKQYILNENIHLL